MSNKLTALTSATLPLAGTEAVYLIQGGNSRQTTASALIATCSILANNETVTGAKTFNSGKLLLAGSVSGTTILNATATASGTITVPATTDTLVGKATTDTFTNKTFDTAGTGNSLLINGVAATANTGTGAVVRATSPTLVTPALGTPASGVVTNLTYTPSGTGAVSRTLPSKFGEHISVADFGAVGNGSTDDTTAIQNALNFIKTQGGGALYFPATTGGYKITSGLTYNDSALSGRFTSRLRIFGDGSASTFITMSGVAANALTITGNASFPEMYTHIEGIRITGNTTTGSIGLSLNVGAFCSTDDLVIEAMDYALDFTDVEQTLFQNSNFRWGNHGVRGNASVSVTSANSIVFLNCAIANNAVWGWQITNPNAVTFIGGSTQYNGATGGGATNWGGNVIEAGNGYGTVGFYGHIWEGNGGNADFISSQSSNTAAYIFEACGFARPNSSNYAVSFVEIDGTTASTYTFTGNTFRGYGTYVPNAGRPYFTVNNTSAKIWDDGSNIYGSATEQPAWAGSAQIPVSAHVGSGGVQIGTFTAHANTDKNFYVGGSANLADGVSIGSINDANNTFKGLELRGSAILLSANTSTSGSLLSTNATGGIGYSTGAGGTVTQATSKSTGVALNKATGQITMNAAALAASTTVSFVMTNTAIAATDLLVLNHVSGGTPGSYTLNGRAAAGSATIDVRNVSLGSLSEAIVIGFAVVKAVTA